MSGPTPPFTVPVWSHHDQEANLFMRLREPEVGEAWCDDRRVSAEGALAMARER